MNDKLEIEGFVIKCNLCGSETIFKQAKIKSIVGYNVEYNDKSFSIYGDYDGFVTIECLVCGNEVS